MAHDSNLSPEEAKKSNIKNIIKVAIILAVVTGIEFAFALNWPDGVDRTLLNILFIALTIVKAFYIVFEFMHLGGEERSLKFAILFPLVFIIWLLVALYVEGGSHL